MSDQPDYEAEDLTKVLVGIYVLIHKVCARLPLPIALPAFDGVFDSTEILPAVIRVTEIIQDQPVDEDIQAGLWGGCLHWLSAAYLFHQWLHSQEDVLATMVRINLVTAGDALVAVAEELTRSEE